MRSQTVKITDILKVTKFTDTKLSDFNASYVRSFLEAQGAYIFAEEGNSIYESSGHYTWFKRNYESSGHYIWFKRNNHVFRNIGYSFMLNADKVIAGITMGASSLGSGTIAITDLAPYYVDELHEIKAYNGGIGFFFEGNINLVVLHNILICSKYALKPNDLYSG